MTAAWHDQQLGTCAGGASHPCLCVCNDCIKKLVSNNLCGGSELLHVYLYGGNSKCDPSETLFFIITNQDKIY